MDAWMGPPRRLHPRGPAARGLVVDRDEVMLGPDCMLVRRTGHGYRSIAQRDTAWLQRFVFDEVDDGTRWSRAPTGMVKAQLLGLQLPLTDLEPRHLHRLDASIHEK